MIFQTRLPLKWVIVSDGSMDGTDEIVGKYLTSYPWIELVRMPDHAGRDFSAKVNCFNAGYAKVKDLHYDIIGNLDADISFGIDYFEYLLNKFCDEPRLGCAGTPFVEQGKHYDYRYTNIEHVSGACQLFRADCFEDIGGYTPIAGGGIDWVAVTTARMKGWTTRTFTDHVLEHHRPMGTGSGTLVRARYRLGVKDYNLGNSPVWELFRCGYQMKTPPRVIGALAVLAGYVLAWQGHIQTAVKDF